MKRIILIFIFFFTTLFSGFSCFWDYDTLEMERQRFPNIIELISGKFLRHSPEFYRWRIQNREERLKNHPDSLDLYDDLAVSYSKIGDHQKAIDVILQKELKRPQQYKTYANLGTFYLHNGEFKKGIIYIDKAIQINPNAHFGREIYQRHLAAYILTKMKNGKISLPLSTKLRRCLECPPRNDLDNFYNFLIQQYSSQKTSNKPIKTLPDEELEKAIIGIKGMMKFGNYNSPILLEALGDLLMASGQKEGARQLAARAYFKASYHSKNIETTNLYKQKVAFVLYHQFTKRQGKRFTITELENLLKEEIAEGVNFYNTIRRDEMNWIQLGKNPEQEFSKKYYSQPSIGRRVQKTNTTTSNVENHYKKFTSIQRTKDSLFTPEGNTLLNDTLNNQIENNTYKNRSKEESVSTTVLSQKNNKTSYWIPIILVIILGVITVLLIVKRKPNR
ncbi:hypothetical protein [Aquimarina sp. 2201CG5-10]|uniref:tetratricopeptide repeat protein n=1 Tax=Aquimarina callyspongiae TaxID=3098150 RepID=UPI002AB593AE|nr:hypothetical protein [Aquimarina sp. 2201CG5-10]MDY8135100.1 hypothetical protein [Aquimarina sp. 2201CG5-10]